MSFKIVLPTQRYSLELKKTNFQLEMNKKTQK